MKQLVQWTVTRVLDAVQLFFNHMVSFVTVFALDLIEWMFFLQSASYNGSFSYDFSLHPWILMDRYLKLPTCLSFFSRWSFLVPMFEFPGCSPALRDFIYHAQKFSHQETLFGLPSWFAIMGFITICQTYMRMEPGFFSPSTIEVGSTSRTSLRCDREWRCRHLLTQRRGHKNRSIWMVNSSFEQFFYHDVYISRLFG